MCTTYKKYIKIMQEQLIKCPRCESPYCYQKISEAYLENNCLYCGYTTSSYMIKGSEQAGLVMSKLPKFYEGVKFVDEDGFIWVPRYYEIEGVGRLYANVLFTGVWVWTFERFVEVPESEKELYKTQDGKYLKYKADDTKAQHFKQNEYVLGLMALGVFKY